MTFRVSARALQEYLARRMEYARFKGIMFGDDNFFDRALGAGMTISSVSLEEAGLDEDDDYVVIEFSPDAAVRRLTPPEEDRKREEDGKGG